MTVAMAIGFGVAVAYSQMSQWHTMTAQQRVAFEPVSASMTGVMIAAVILGALAVKTGAGHVVCHGRAGRMSPGLVTASTGGHPGSSRCWT